MFTIIMILCGYSGLDIVGPCLSSCHTFGIETDKWRTIPVHTANLYSIILLKFNVYWTATFARQMNPYQHGYN